MNPTDKTPPRNLDRCRIEQQIKSTKNERYRVYLERVLKDLRKGCKELAD